MIRRTVLTGEVIGRIRRILFIQTAFLGDVVFSTALLRACREVFDRASITVLASPRGGGVLEGDPDVAEVIYYDKRGRQSGLGGFLEVLGEVGKRDFDLVVCPHRSFRSAIIARLTKAPYRLGFRSLPTAWAWNLGISAPAGEKRPFRKELLLLESVIGRDLPQRPSLKVGEKERREAEAVFVEAGLAGPAPVVGLIIGTVWPTKKWPVTCYRELGKTITDSGRARVVILGGAADRLEGETAAASGVVNLAGKTDLRLLPAILRQCSVIVGSDTGPLHAAMALDVRVVALFGPTSEAQFEFGPGDQCLAVNLDCRPCTPHGSRRCPVNDWRCMPEIGVERVRAAVMSALDRVQ